MKFNFLTIILAFVMLTANVLAWGDDIPTEEVPVTNASIDAGETVTWTNDKIWVLEELVFVEEGATLIIEAGTIIWGKSGTEHEAKALIIARGGKIYAEGTPNEPIIFTAYGDNPFSTDDGFDLTETGKWGGVIILGKAPTNNVAQEYVKNIEGISEDIPEGKYGAPPAETDPMDNSGVFRYVQIRHGGTDIGDGNEINGLTMGAVGAGTVIDHVEVWYNQDDGFEWFGGTVFCTHLVSAFNRDDSFDYDEGWNGGGQFWFSIQDEGRGNNGGEHDGGNKPDNQEPFATPVIYNATYIGSGIDSENSKSRILHFRDNAGGTYANSIFMETGGKGIDVEDLDAENPDSEEQDSRKRLEAGDLNIMNNIWWNISKAGCTLDDISPDVPDTEKDGEIIPGYSEQFVRDYLSTHNNNIVDPMISGISRNLGGPGEEMPDGGLDPRPLAGSPAFTLPRADYPAGDHRFMNVPYMGAFGPGELWLDKWTFLAQSGLLKSLRHEEMEVPVTDASINAGETVTWTSDKIWVLEELVFVEDGATLIIEPGTLIWGRSGTEHDAKALIIARGGKIMAQGTPTQPIIFTAYGDNPHHDDDGFDLTETGKWGGVIILGKAPTNNVAQGYVKNIEGISEEIDAGKYGAPPAESDPMDNSGVFSYVQIRHGGTDIGDGNEINGLTMGAVGAGTKIDHVEVWYNQDDGFEWFGGTVNCKYLVSAFNRDDSFDYDEGWSGKGQFWFSIQDEGRGNNGGEHDGGNKPDNQEPYAIPYIYNVTYVGSGLDSENSKSQVLHLRDNAGGKYFNSIFMDQKGKGIDIEDLDADNPDSEEQDSRKRLELGDLEITNNIWWNIGKANPTWNDISPDVPDTEKDGKVIPGYSEQFVRDYLPANNNTIEDPMLVGISRNLGGPGEEMPDGGLLPIPAPGSPAYTNALADYLYRSTETENNFFEDAPFQGAIGMHNWLADWTFLSQCGLLNTRHAMIQHLPLAAGVQDAPPSAIEEYEANFDGMLYAYPNPMTVSTNVEFAIANSQHIAINVYNTLGVKVATLVNKYMNAGQWGVKWTPENLSTGVYIIRLEAQEGVISTKVIVK